MDTGRRGFLRAIIAATIGGVGVDDRTERRRIDDLQADVEQAIGPAPDLGAPTVLVKTATKAAYPTAAARYYWCEVQRLGGAEVEGGTATFTATGNHLFAYNRGKAVPPTGTAALATLVGGGRWTFRYDG
jgi:hypothetical protein